MGLMSIYKAGEFFFYSINSCITLKKKMMEQKKKEIIEHFYFLSVQLECCSMFNIFLQYSGFVFVFFYNTVDSYFYMHNYFTQQVNFY